MSCWQKVTDSCLDKRELTLVVTGFFFVGARNINSDESPGRSFGMARRISPPLQRFLHCSSCYRSINIFHKMFIFFICIIQCRILTHYVTCVMRAGAVRSTYRTPIHTQYSMIQGVLYAYICLESRIWRGDKMKCGRRPIIWKFNPIYHLSGTRTEI